MFKEQHMTALNTFLDGTKNLTVSVNEALHQVLQTKVSYPCLQVAGIVAVAAGSLPAVALW